MGTFEKSLKNKEKEIEPGFDSMKNIGNLLGQNFTADILFLISQEPMRNKQLKTILKCKDNTLSRRLHRLMENGIIEKLAVTIENRNTHEYVITDKGQELIRFFKSIDIK